MGQIAGRNVYPPSETGNLEFDFCIISIAKHEEMIKKKLIENHKVPDEKIVVWQPIEKGSLREDERIGALRKCIDMLKERNIPGNMAEVGVFQGDFSRLFNRYFPERKLYLFDTFEGFNPNRDEVNFIDIDRFKDTSIELVLSRMKTPENCVLRKGYFPDTAIGIEDKFCLVSLDADLYNPIFAGLEYFYPRLVAGGYIFVHDFGSLHFKGVKKAVYDYCRDHHMAMVPITDRCLSVITTK